MFMFSLIISLVLLSLIISLVLFSLLISLVLLSLHPLKPIPLLPYSPLR